MHHHLVALLAQRGVGEHAVANEFGHKSGGRAVIKAVGVAPLVQAPLGHDTNHIAHGKCLHLVVGDKQGRGLGLFEDGAHLLGQAFAQVHIEVGKRLIEQQQLGLGRQGPRQCHALLLAATELVRQALGRR